MTKRVLVLGAGFTRAFFPKAPLMVGDYDGKLLLERFGSFDQARLILKQELERNGGTLINIEDLMTRLDGGMPYDESRGALQELHLLLSHLKQILVEKIEQARHGDNYQDDLRRFAAYCVKHKINSISFNYDDTLDEALSLAPAFHTENGFRRFWTPADGYGFLCTLSGPYDKHGLGRDFLALLLKMHGSLNWRIKLGAQRPYSVDALVHFPDWESHKDDSVYRPDIRIAANLEPDPFIVPPVLLKGDLTKESILRVVWTAAFGELFFADEVTFVGYSLPFTDVASRTLFMESLNRFRPVKIKVVNYIPESNQEGRRRIVDAYQRVLPALKEEDFDFRGALEWCREFVSQREASSK